MNGSFSLNNIHNNISISQQDIDEDFEEEKPMEN